MQISPDTMRLLMDLDAPAEQKIALMKAMEADWLAYQAPAKINGVNEERERLRNESTYAERKRAKDRERQRQLREAARQSRDPAATSRDIAGDPSATLGDSRSDPATVSHTHVEYSSLPSLRSEEIVGGGVGSASAIPVPDDWPSGKADLHAKLLVETVASPWLDPDKSPDLVTTRGRVAAWKRDGASWEHDVLPVVTGLCANRRSRISSWKFFDAAISRSIAENRAALEIPEARGNRPTGPPSITDRMADERRQAESLAFQMLDAQDGRTN